MTNLFSPNSTKYIVNRDSDAVFKSSLKTFLFSRAFSLLSSQ